MVAIGFVHSSAGPSIADIQARLHDPHGANLALKTPKENPHNPSIAAMAQNVRRRLAPEAGDVASAAMEMEAYGAAGHFDSSNSDGGNLLISAPTGKGVQLAQESRTATCTCSTSMTGCVSC
jgi:hypothetical protein